ncbi:MAG: glycosyltransferase family 39 protein [bacterium]|nr:glycosyltransferase family 39 protein [bacterium]
MITIKIILFFISLILPGYLITELLLKRRPFLFKLALAWGLGAALIPLELFIWFFIFKLPLNLAYFYLWQILQISLLLWAVVKSGDFTAPSLKINRPKIKPLPTIIFMLILTQLFFLLFNALAKPPIAYDNLTMWQYKAKTLYYQNTINFNQPEPDYLGGGGHINYPWQIPLLNYWLYANLGEFNDSASNLIYPIYYLSILIIIYYFLKKYLAASLSLLFVWLFSILPLPFYHAYNGYADLTLSFYLLLAFIFLFYWLENQAKKYLLLAGLFFACALFTKNDALIFASAGLLTIIISLFLAKQTAGARLALFGAYLAAIILPILPWLAVKIKYGLAFSNVEPGLAYHPQIWKNLYRAIFLSGSFNILWFAAMVALAVNLVTIRRQKFLWLAWLFLLLDLAGLTALYLLTEEYRVAIDGTALSRNLLALAPIAIVLTAVSFAPASAFAIKD